ncbi:MAG: metal ABC transporter permease, partial [Planctomycetota bacterium]
MSSWTHAIDTWIVVIGVLCATSCALLGNFLVLRRLSMMGDAISHAVLPGLAIAFLISGSRASVGMFLGAAIAGVLTALFTQWVHGIGRVDRGASMGVVFTTLFALGLVLIVRAADHVDLDPGCVLYGSIELAPLDRVELGGVAVPRAALVLGGVLLLNATCVALLFKELRISGFDPDLATTLGINASVMHYLLMTLVAITTVACFESIGSILVIAMLIVPAAAAHLLTDRLGTMIAVSLVIAAASAALGHVAAITVPPWIGFRGTSTSGMMATVAGVLFAGSMLLGPRHGIISRLVHRGRLRARILREDVLALLYRLEETPAAGPVTAPQLGAALQTGRIARTR